MIRIQQKDLGKVNDTQMLAMATKIVAPVKCDFAGIGSTAKVERIKEYENCCSVDRTM